MYNVQYIIVRMGYKCDKCDKEFAKKGDFDRHINRKNPCKMRIIKNHKRIFNESPKKDNMDINYNKLESQSEVDCIKENIDAKSNTP